MPSSRGEWTVRRLAEFVTVLIIAVAAIGSFVIGFFFSFGAWKDKVATIDIQNVSRTMAGVFGAFALAAGAQLLATQKRIDEIADKLAEQQHSLGEMLESARPGVDALLKNRDDLPPWRASITKCQRLKMSGLSLRTFTKENLVSVRGMLRNGGTADFLLLEPNSQSSAVTALNFLGENDPTRYDMEVAESLTRLARLREEFKGQVSVRTLNHLPATSITVLDSDSSGLSVYVEFYTEEESSIGRPHLQLTPQEAPLWCEYFRQQFDILWHRGVDYVPGE